jgi:predicted nucleic acid-binding protein
LPQLDTNFLIRLLKGEPEFVAYARANQAAGLAYSQPAADEFLAAPAGSAAQLKQLEQDYGVVLLTNPTTTAIDIVAKRLQNAFVGDSFHRILPWMDALILGVAFLTGDCLATGDLKLFKRARDLGVSVEFVGSAAAARRAAGYAPRIVVVPPP